MKQQSNLGPIIFKQPIRPLHWVIKVSNLKETIDLFTVLGCRVLRHEEFEQGCEASCNGPYSGYWSKTMVGYENEDISFVLELTFNYGITKYQRGNDLQAILMHKFNKIGEDIEKKLEEKFPEAQLQINADGVYQLINDDILIKFDNSQAKAKTNQLFKGIVINVTSIEDSLQYYKKIGFEEKNNKIMPPVLLCPTYDYFELHLVLEKQIFRGEAFGRLAVSCDDEDVEKVFQESQSEIINAPITLKTLGKADVIVTILSSPDSQELCFVNDIGFRDLSKESGEKIDWERYQKLNEVQIKYRNKFGKKQDFEK